MYVKVKGKRITPSGIINVCQCSRGPCAARANFEIVAAASA